MPQICRIQRHWQALASFFQKSISLDDSFVFSHKRQGAMLRQTVPAHMLHIGLK